MNLEDLTSLYCPLQHFQLLHKLMKDVTTILHNHNIEYWIDGGNMLGMIRFKNQLLWDDDIDLGITLKSYSQITKISEEFIKAGYSFINESEILKVFVPNRWLISGKHKKIIGTPTLDIFVYSLNKHKGKRVYCLNDPVMRKIWPNAYHEKNDLFPLQEIDYKFPWIDETIRTYMPNNCIPYLDRSYPGWEDIIKVEIRSSLNPKAKAEIVSFKVEDVLKSISEKQEKEKIEN
jgi:hypothetical protein